jgi:hypothetical protein
MRPYHAGDASSSQIQPVPGEQLSNARWLHLCDTPIPIPIPIVLNRLIPQTGPKTAPVFSSVVHTDVSSYRCWLHLCTPIGVWVCLQTHSHTAVSEYLCAAQRAAFNRDKRPDSTVNCVPTVLRLDRRCMQPARPASTGRACPSMATYVGTLEQQQHKELTLQSSSCSWTGQDVLADIAAQPVSQRIMHRPNRETDRDQGTDRDRMQLC